MQIRDKNRGLIVVSIILLLLNLSFSLLSAKLLDYQNNKDAIGLSGPIVSFGQTAEIVVVAALKRSTNISGFKLVKDKTQKSFVFVFIALGLIIVFYSNIAIFKTTRNLKLEGG